MLKKFAIVLVALLVLPTVLTACSSDSADTAKDYVDAILKGEDAQKYACDSYKDATAALVDANNAMVGEGHAIRNIDLKYDIGKGGNEEEVIVTGSYDLVELNEAGKVVADSEDEYELASSTRDKRDLNKNGDDQDKINTRLVLTMKKQGGDWCVQDAEGGYFSPDLGEAGEAGEVVEPANEATEAATEEPTAEATEAATEEVTPEPTKSN
jgi:hypothetical protein